MSSDDLLIGCLALPFHIDARLVAYVSILAQRQIISPIYSAIAALAVITKNSVDAGAKGKSAHLSGMMVTKPLPATQRLGRRRPNRSGRRQ